MADAAKLPKLTLTDQVFVNAMAYLVTAGFEPENIDMALGVVRELLPQVTEAHPRVSALAAAAEGMLNARRRGTQKEAQKGFAYHAALARRELSQLFLLRAGEGWDRLQGQKRAA